MKYRKKPVEINALQWTGQNTAEAMKFLAAHAADFDVRFEGAHPARRVVVETLEGDMTCSPHDFLIVGIKGEVYPCKPDIFAATYEAVSE